MAVTIGHASIDENGKTYGGKAGDNNGKEVYTRTWYAGNWSVLLRPKKSTIAEKIAKACEAGCANNHIGYNQYKRNTLRTQAKAVNYDLSKITVDCDTDCSAFMTVCCECAGIDMDGAYTSGNAPVTQTMRSKFVATGEFTALTDSKYLTGSDYLKRGDILVKESGHTAMVLTNGTKSGTTSTTSTVTKTSSTSTDSTLEVAHEFDRAISGYYNTTANSLNIRYKAGTDSDDTIIAKLTKGTSVRCYGYYNIVDDVKWYLVQTGTHTGYVSSEWLEKE
jgi:hypothetical protein